jgi:hypothetical protein
MLKLEECGRKLSLPVFKVLESRKTIKTLNQDIRCPERDLNQEPPEYKSALFQLKTLDMWQLIWPCLSVCNSVRKAEKFFLLEIFTKICRHIQILIKIWETISDNKYRPAYLQASRSQNKFRGHCWMIGNLLCVRQVPSLILDTETTVLIPILVSFGFSK